MQFPKSPSAASVRKLVDDLQSLWVHSLESLSLSFGAGIKLQQHQWLRDGGRHGGGNRYALSDCDIFNRVALNVSSVHYDDLPDKKLSSATALSCIIHPKSPYAPSIHTHISWTEMRDTPGVWRIMADLNPSNSFEKDKKRFEDAIKVLSSDLHEHACQQGDKYFYIPALNRHRGVFHFYLESFRSQNADADYSLAQDIGVGVIKAYASIAGDQLATHRIVDPKAETKQLAYHSLYFLQVLTMDRGTTSGILVHSQNDVGIMGSLPHRVDKDLLKTWIEKLPSPQDQLLRKLISVLPDEQHPVVSDTTRIQLAQVVREHYRAHPEALSLQASGFTTPPTVENHLGTPRS